MVDWKKLPKIDAHIHLMPPDVIQANQGSGDPFVAFGGVADYLRLMAAYHIEAAFVMPFNDPYMLSMDFKVESVHANLQAMAHGSSRKLQCFADVDIRNPIGRTLRELDNALGQRGFLGIKLHPANAGYPIDGAYYDPIFQYASHNGVLVEIHSYPRERLTDDVCSPRRIQTVLKKYPQLRVSIAHLGGFQYEELYGMNAYCNLSAILPDLAARLGIEKTNQVLRTIGVHKLVFATDYPDSRRLRPNEIYETYFEILGNMDFSQEEAEKICRGNAQKMTRGLLP